MKKIIKKFLPILIILLLSFSIPGNLLLLNRNIYINKRVDTLNKKLAEYDEDYIKYADLYNKCEYDLDGTKKSLQKITNELNALKKAAAKTNKKYKITSYYTGDSTGSGTITASGLWTKDFQINEKGWYTYKGKVVVATANRSLLKYGWPAIDGIIYYKLYDTFTLVIDGISYPAIVLDSCGACMKSNIIDLFVSGSEYSITTNNAYIK